MSIQCATRTARSFFDFRRNRCLRSNDWLECVRRLQPYYPKTLFFRLNRVLLGTDAVSPTYLRNFRMSRFDLLEETDYSLECLYYHPASRGDIPLSIKSDSEQIEISNTFASSAGLLYLYFNKT